MKEDWTYKKLGEVARFSRGLTYSKHDEVDSSENVVLRSNNIDLLSGKLDFSEMKYLKSEFSIPDDKRLKKGSLFICMSNGSKSHLGKVAYVDKDYYYAFGGFMGQITPDDSINGRFLHYALCSPMYKDYIKSLSAGANINNLKYKDLELFEINFAPLKEQQRIVERLDAAFAHIDELKTNAEKQLTEARVLFQKSLAKAMEPKEGWEEKTLSEVCEVNRGRSKHRPRNDKKLYGGPYPFIQTGDVRNAQGGEIKDYSQTYSELGLSQSKLWKKGTICITIAANIGETAILGFDACFPDSVVGIYPNDTLLNALFLNYYLVSIKKDIDSQSYGTAQKNINLEVLNNIILRIPPLSEQQRIVERLYSLREIVRKYEDIQRKIIAECDALKQALLRKVFE